MKKSFSLGLLTVFLSVQVFSAYAIIMTESYKIHEVMTGAHTALFGVNNIFAKAPSSTDIKNWKNVVVATENFIKKNAKEEYKKKLGIKYGSDKSAARKKFLQVMNVLKKANDKLIIIIEDSYRLFFAKAADYSLKKKTADSMRYLINDILKAEKDITESSKVKYIFDINTECVKLLQRLAITLSTSAEKVQRDLLR